MTVKQICDMIPLTISLLISLFGLITAFVRAQKAKNWENVKAILCDLIIKAESLVGLSGEEKKKTVMSWAEEFCKEQGFDFEADKVSSAIETLLDLTLKVNVNSKDKNINANNNTNSVAKSEWNIEKRV